MPSDRDDYHGSGRDHDRVDTSYYKSVWTKTPTGDYSGEPNYLSADVFNLLINEMQINKNNITASPKVYSKAKASSNASIPGYVGSGTKYSAADWNNVCNQVATLISDAKRALENSVYQNKAGNEEASKFISQMRNVINVSESEAYALRYGSGELLNSGKTLTRLINIVRRARIHCTCHAEYYKPCNHCAAYTCRRDGWGCGSDR
jgi:hypothetical protein